MMPPKQKFNNMPKRILTEEDFINNPSLASEGLKVGDEIEYPELEANENLSDDDTGGSAPPPNKEG
jgi:hypothetical protein